MTTYRKLFAPVSLALALMTTQAVAKINPVNFKGVTSHFSVKVKDVGNKKKDRKTLIRKNDNKENISDSTSGTSSDDEPSTTVDNTMYSPTFEIVALDTGIVENIRLYGDYTPGFDKDGKRLYVKDESDDPLWNVVNILFPTNAGVLNAQTDAKSNFGKYVKDPKTVAMLVNFAKKIYDSGKDMIDKDIVAFGKTIIETLNDAKDLDKRDLTALGKNVNNLLRFIQSAIKAEKDKSSLYPKYTTVQMIQAFFCYKFNTKDDIAEELKHLDTSIVDGNRLSPDLLKEEDLKEIIKKDTPDIDDLFDLTQTYLFTSPMPYKDGIAPLQNGGTYHYERGKGDYDKKQTFPDCVEVSIRHLCNLLFFDAKDRVFDVSHINNTNLKNFYEQQSPLLANAGGIDMRSLWNSVVGDLNTKDDTDPIIYNKTNNEVDTGFGNMMRVLSKVLNITFDKTFGNLPSDTLKNKTTWLQTSLQKLLETMNPSYMYEVNLKGLKDYNEDIAGDASIKVSKKEVDTEEVKDGESVTKAATFKAGNDLFSFTIMQSGGHANINTLKNLKSENDTKEIDKALTKHASILHTNDMEESLMLLSPTLSQNITHSLYKLFTQPLSDNNSKIAFLGRVMDLAGEDKEEKGFFKTHLNSVKQMMVRVMDSLSWDDRAVRHKVNPVVLSMLQSDDFKDVAYSHAKYVTIEDLDWDGVVEIAGKYTKLGYVNLSNNKKITGTVTLPKSWGQLRWLILNNTSVETIEGLENVPNLETLHLGGTKKLKSLLLKEDMPELKDISLLNSGVKTLTLSGSMSKLEMLDLKDTTNLTSLVITKDMKALKQLDLSNSTVKTIELSGAMPNLGTLDLGNTKNLISLVFKGDMKTLKTLDLSRSGARTIELSGAMPNLEMLNLNSTKNLTSLTFAKPETEEAEKALNNLKIDLDDSGIKNKSQITGYDYLDEGNVKW